MADISSGLSHDKRRMQIAIEGEDGKPIAAIVLEAHEVETLLLQLGRTRAEMEPPVIPKPDPNPIFRDVTRDAVFHVDRQHVVGKEFFLAARHPGFGWLAFTMNAEHGLLLSGLINRQVQAITPKIIKPDSGLIV